MVTELNTTQEQVTEADCGEDEDKESANDRADRVFAELDGLKSKLAEELDGIQEELEDDLAQLLKEADAVRDNLAKIAARKAQAKGEPAPVVRAARGPRKGARGPRGPRVAGETVPDIIVGYLTTHPGSPTADILAAAQAKRPKTKPGDVAATLFRLKKDGRLKAKGKRGSMAYSVA